MKIAMRRLYPPTLTSVSCAANCGSPTVSYYSQSISKAQQSSEDFRSKLLDRRWTLANPDAKVHQIMLRPKQMQREGDLFQEMSLSNVTNPSLGNEMMKMGCQDSSFYIVRDDLIHPLINGNKARKLDALLPLLEDHSITDVVTCGGCQSAHTAAVAVSCAERGLNSHLLLRGEQPDILTGYNLISTMYGNVIYVPRSLYADREAMFQMHAASVADSDGCVLHLTEMLDTFHTQEKFGSCGAQVSRENCLKKVAVINEGAGDSLALLGVIRQVCCLSEYHLFGKERPIRFVVDAGTGTTAVGLGLAAICLGLPWEITAVMLADTVDEYRRREQWLISEFRRHFGFNLEYCSTQIDVGVVNWVERIQPRKFGNVMKGEVEACQRIAQQTGVLVDPVYTLAAWEMAALLSKEEELDEATVVMLHTGGTLGMFGLAQRYKSYFKTLKDVNM